MPLNSFSLHDFRRSGAFIALAIGMCAIRFVFISYTLGDWDSTIYILSEVGELSTLCITLL